MNDFPRILTFYSFKGGVGRSMAVLNAAHALAAKGRHVLVLDMDLEAPGLSGFLRRHDEIGRCARQDMVDLVRWARDCAGRELSEPVDPAAFPPLSEFVVRVPRDMLAGLAKAWPDLGRVDVIPVDEERDYYGRLAALAIGNFDQEALIRVGSILRDWLKSRVFELEVPEYYGPGVERAAKYDYVLVDSRTGVTETGGLCIGPLSDQLVVLTALNDQNVEGTRRFLTEVGILAPQDVQQEASPEPSAPRRLDPKPTLIVASPVPAGEIATKQERLQRLEQAVGQVVAKLSYHPQMALLESVFTRDHPDEYLAKEYAALVDNVLRASKDDIGFDVLEEIPSVRIRSALALREPLRKALRLGAIGAKLLLLLHQMRDDDTLTEDEDFVLSDCACRVLTAIEPQSRLDVLIRSADILARWSKASASEDLVASRRDAAMLRYREVIESPVASTSQKARALFNRGVTYGKQGDTDNALSDYTAVVQVPDAPAEQKAQALVNRGATHGQRGDTDSALADLTAVVQMAHAPAEQKAKALVNRGVMHGRRGDTDSEIADYTAVVQMPDAPAEQNAKALVNRGVVYRQRGDTDSALADYTAVVQTPDAPAEQKASALFNRGVIHGRRGDTDSALADYTAVVQMPDAPAEQKAGALVNRGVTHGKHGDTDSEIADYTAVVQMPDAPAEQKADALFNRGVTHGRQGDTDSALADYTAVVQLPDAPAEQKAAALVNRGATHGQRGDTDSALADYTAVVQMPDAPAEQKAKALVNRGTTHGQRDDTDSALADLTAVVQMPDVPAEQKANALFNRGVTHGQRGDTDSALADYTAVVQMPDAPAEQKAKALVNRGMSYRQRGDTDSALADYTAVVQMPDAPAEQKAQALFNRGVTHGQRGDTNTALGDYKAVVQMPDAPAEQKAQAMVNRGWSHYVAGRYTEAIQDGQAAVAMDGTFCTARGNLAIALLVTGQTAEALAAYDAALQIASPKDVTEMAADLDEAVSKHDSVAGADEVRSRIESRRATLQG